MTSRRCIFLIFGLLAMAGAELDDFTLSAAARPIAAKPAIPPEPVIQAQERGQFNFFDLLFGPPRSRRLRERISPPERRDLGPETLAVEPPPPPAVQKDPDARKVYVFGDIFANGLGDGLAEAFSETPTIQIVTRVKPDSGLVRDDFYDWQTVLEEIQATEQIDVAVIMIGSNDRQPIRLADGSQEDVRTERWEEIYISRVDAVLRLFSGRGIPVYWVGLPIMRPQNYGQDIAYLNEVFLARTQRAGGVFIDTWSRFADEEGGYSAVGPDINGKMRRLRNENGIHMTKTGSKKLAFFVEQVLRADLEDGALARYTDFGQVLEPGRRRGPIEVELSLTNPEAPPANAPLAGGWLDRKAGAPSDPGVDYRLLVLGESPAPKVGRADDFSWPPLGAGENPAAQAAE